MASRASSVACFLGVLLACLIVKGSAGFTAVINRDLDGAVLGSGFANYTSSAYACASLCKNTTGANIWVWCGSTFGCTTGQGSYQQDLSKYRQCYCKFDTVRSGFPFWKNQRDAESGWISGTFVPGPNAAAYDQSGRDVSWGNQCRCKETWQYTIDGVTKTFKGICANPKNDYSPQCEIETCTNYQPGLQGCSTQSCTALAGTDLDGTVLVSGDNNYKGSATDCCAQCASTKDCQIWVWCSDANGCGDGLRRFRQCWLKKGDPTKPKPKANAHPGWISGVRMAYL